MVQAIIDIDDHTNRILNIIKAKFGLTDKSQAIEEMAKGYEAHVLEPELRPEYLAKLQEVKKQKGTRFKSVADLRRQLEHA